MNSFGIEDDDYFMALKKAVKRSVNDRNFLVISSERVETIIELTEIIIQLVHSEKFTFETLRLLSELSVIFGLLRNISTVSPEIRKRLRNSELLSDLSFFIYVKLNNQEKYGFFNFISHKMLAMVGLNILEGDGNLSIYLNECLLFPCRFMQLLANVCVDSTPEYKDYFFKMMYPFGLMNISFVELIWIESILNDKREMETTSVGTIFHLLYNLIKCRPNTLSDIIGRKELLGCFLYVALSFYLNEIKYSNSENLKSSEWIFFFFRKILSENPNIFCELYSFNHSEDTSTECDASLIYLTIQEPLVKLSLLEKNTINISEAKTTREIQLVQKYLKKTMISEFEFKEVLLEILLELGMNSVYKVNCSENEETVVSKVVSLKDTWEIILNELVRGASYLGELSSYLSSLDTSNDLGLDGKFSFKLQNLGNLKGWISVLRIRAFNYKDHFELYCITLEKLVSIIGHMINLRNSILRLRVTGNDEVLFIWKQISEEVSLSSAIQAISTICYSNVELQDFFGTIQNGKLSTSNKLHYLMALGINIIIECTTILDEMHPFVKEASAFAIHSISINNPKISKTILECKNEL
ncbi:Spinocerebellar ataxia type 10 domain protein [Cryptosporidium felis]|nr:Spinocerebellar ataxia type 10 domain protein [Cryptosporidium felis]